MQLSIVRFIIRSQWAHPATSACVSPTSFPSPYRIHRDNDTSYSCALMHNIRVWATHIRPKPRNKFPNILTSSSGATQVTHCMPGTRYHCVPRFGKWVRSWPDRWAHVLFMRYLAVQGGCACSCCLCFLVANLWWWMCWWVCLRILRGGPESHQSVGISLIQLIDRTMGVKRSPIS